MGSLLSQVPISLREQVPADLSYLIDNLAGHIELDAFIAPRAGA